MIRVSGFRVDWMEAPKLMAHSISCGQSLIYNKHLSQEQGEWDNIYKGVDDNNFDFFLLRC
jgi:hypothetical protein